MCAQLDGQRVQDALARLPFDYREAVILRYREELSMEDLAAALEISVSGAKMRVHRGLRKLREMMETDDHGKQNALDQNAPYENESDELLSFSRRIREIPYMQPPETLLPSVMAAVRQKRFPVWYRALRWPDHHARSHLLLCRPAVWLPLWCCSRWLAHSILSKVISDHFPVPLCKTGFRLL